VAAALVLLIGAGLLLSSLARLQRVEPGFDPDGVVTVEVMLPPQRYPTDTARRDRLPENRGHCPFDLDQAGLSG
jgi:hypothetical protein